MRLAGKVAIVTGAARGMGKSHADLLSAHGASVILTDVLDDLGKLACEELELLGRSVTYVHLDVTSSDEWEHAVAVAEFAFGPPNVLVNNAGIISEGGAVDEPEEDWRRVIDVNQTGVFLGMKHVVPAMRKAGGGSIINVSSVLGVRGAEDYISYQASKGAVLAMTRSAALSYASDDIRVNAICPGHVRTPMTDALPSEIREQDVADTPLGRTGTPGEISQGVLFLASDESSYVTGSHMQIDGGYLA